MLAILLAIAVAYDLRERRIPNSLIVCGLVLALGGSGYLGGWAGLGASLAATLLGMAVYVPFFAVRMVGAGDVKLFGVVAGFAGLGALWPVWLYTVLAGGVLGLISVILSRSFPLFLSNMKLLLISLTYRVRGSEMSLSAIATRTSARIPYAVAIAAGAMYWMASQS